MSQEHHKRFKLKINAPDDEVFPVVQVGLDKQGYLTPALIDTGAQECMLVMDPYFRLLGLKWDDGEDVPVRGVGGDVKGRRFRIDVEVAGIKVNKCPVVFVDDLPCTKDGIMMVLGLEAILVTIGPICFEANSNGGRSIYLILAN